MNIYLDLTSFRENGFILSLFSWEVHFLQNKEDSEELMKNIEELCLALDLTLK